MSARACGTTTTAAANAITRTSHTTRRLFVISLPRAGAWRVRGQKPIGGGPRSPPTRAPPQVLKAASPSPADVMFEAKAFIEGQVAAIRGAIGGGRAVIACSGGVDSAVAAVLASQALGD